MKSRSILILLCALMLLCVAGCVAVNMEESSTGGAGGEAEADGVQVYEYHEDFLFAAAKLINEHDTETYQRAGSLTDLEKTECYTGRLIVWGEPDFSSYKPAAVLRGPLGEYVVQFNTPKEAELFLNEQSKNPAVEAIEEDKIVEMDFDSDPVMVEPIAAAAAESFGATGSEGEAQGSGSGSQPFDNWGSDYIGAADYAGRIKKNSLNRTATVAVVDTGVDAGHSYLKSHVLSGVDFVNSDYDPNDENGHGTHVAGIIVDCMQDLSVRILPVRVLDAKGSGSMYIIMQGIRWAADNGASVINLSLGGEGVSTTMQKTVSYAVEKGCVLCISAGNDSKNTANYQPANVNVEGAITVSAIDSRGGFASFSNFGSEVDVAAPGVEIVSTYPGNRYARMNGTSMAAPHVSAAAAMAQMANPGYAPDQIEKIIRKAAVDLGNPNWDQYYGYGALELKGMGVAETLSARSLRVISQPAKTEYTVGESLDIKGLSVEAKMSDGSTREVSRECRIDPAVFEEAGNKTVVLRYGECYCYVTVKVKAKPVQETPKPQAGTDVKITLSKSSGSGTQYCDTDASHCGSYKRGYIVRSRLCWEIDLPAVTVTGTGSNVSGNWEIVDGSGFADGKKVYATAPGTLKIRYFIVSGGKRYYSDTYKYELKLTRTFSGGNDCVLYKSPILGTGAFNKTGKSIKSGKATPIYGIYVAGTPGTSGTWVWLRVGTDQWVRAFYWL